MVDLGLPPCRSLLEGGGQGPLADSTEASLSGPEGFEVCRFDPVAMAATVVLE
jgi:hypothetical protein